MRDDTGDLGESQAGETGQHASAPPLGQWQCDLPCGTLTWSDDIYDLFELPRGLRLTRDEVLGFYTPKSRDMLEHIRSWAIEAGRGFTLDAEITTALGNSRRMRITAHVTCENDVPVRISGTKQNLTR